MHTGIFGPCGSGKTTLARELARAYSSAGFACLICDPIGAEWPRGSWSTTDPATLLAKARRSRNCRLFIEEASLSISRDRDLSWLFTTARHFGHRTHVIGQDGASLLPAMRQQLSEVFLFRCHPDLAAIWSRQFADPEILKIAPTLEKFQFLRARAFEKPVILTLDANP